MDRLEPRILARGLALLLLLGGCAHSGAGRNGGAAAEAERPVRVLVTGSRIPRYVVPGSSAALASDAPVRIYGRDQIQATGREGNLAAALRTLDPSVSSVGR